MENVEREVTADTPELTADKDARKVAKATVQLIQKGIKDQVFSVSFFIRDTSVRHSLALEQFSSDCRN